MPELPEVETVVRDLRPLLVERTIVQVQSSRKKLRRPWKRQWNPVIVGMCVTAARRRGKWILLDLTPKPNGVARVFRQPLLRVHLGMTGQFTVVPADAPQLDHVHLVLTLDNGSQLRFRDPRRFGAVEFFADRADVEKAMEAQLGPEPFDIDPAYFQRTVCGSGRNLKAILLDQTTVAGVGNIYADEACFRAGLHPSRLGNSLAGEECNRLREAIETVIRRAIDNRGSTIRDYIGGSGLGGQFQNEFAVYARTGEPCPVCGTPIARERLAGRSSHFCPNCQR